MAVDGHAQTGKTSPFNTIGEDFKKHPEKAIELGESENDEPGDSIDDADIMLPPADSLRAYLPMVAFRSSVSASARPSGYAWIRWTGTEEGCTADWT